MRHEQISIVISPNLIKSEYYLNIIRNRCNKKDLDYAKDFVISALHALEKIKC